MTPLKTIYSSNAALGSAGLRPISPSNSNTTSDSTKAPLDIAQKINTIINGTYDFEDRLTVAILVEKLKHNSEFSQNEESLLTIIKGWKQRSGQIPLETFNTNLRNVENWLEDPNHKVRLFHLAVYNGNQAVIEEWLRKEPAIINRPFNLNESCNKNKHPLNTAIEAKKVTVALKLLANNQIQLKEDQIISAINSAKNRYETLNQDEQKLSAELIYQLILKYPNLTSEFLTNVLDNAQPDLNTKLNKLINTKLNTLIMTDIQSLKPQSQSKNCQLAALCIPTDVMIKITEHLYTDSLFNMYNAELDKALIRQLILKRFFDYSIDPENVYLVVP